MRRLGSVAAAFSVGSSTESDDYLVDAARVMLSARPTECVRLLAARNHDADGADLLDEFTGLVDQEVPGLEAACRTRSTSYLLLADGSTPGAGRPADSFVAQLDRTARDKKVIVLCATTPADVMSLPRARRELDVAHALSREVATPAGALMSHDVSLQFVVGHAAKLAEHSPNLLQGPIRTLEDLDAATGSQLVATLTAFFDASYDVKRAARNMFIHPNTLRYRLRKVAESTGLDLNDPRDRLGIEVQLLLRRRPGGTAYRFAEG